MTTRKIRRIPQPQADKRLSRMVIVSAVLHATIITALIITVTRNQSGSPALVAYTVALVDPAALGTNIPSGGGNKTASPRNSAGEENTAAPPPSKPAEKLQPPTQEKRVAEPAPPQEKVKPAETKKAEVKREEKSPAQQEAKKSEPKRAEDASPPPDQVVVKSEVKKPEPKREINTKPETTPAKREEKKPEPKKAEAEPNPERTTTQSETQKTVATSSSSSTAQNAANNPADLSTEERDKKILAALDRIRKQVQEKNRSAEIGAGSGGKASGSGPLTIGGAPGEGGGGVVRGLEFIMYTEQVKRRVKEHWIVTDKRPGLTAVVRFSVQPDGQIFGVELLKPSGDRVFDESTVRAVRSASPLPPPPQAYLQEFATQQVEVSFGGEERVN